MQYRNKPLPFMLCQIQAKSTSFTRARTDSCAAISLLVSSARSGANDSADRSFVGTFNKPALYNRPLSAGTSA